MSNISNKLKKLRNMRGMSLRALSKAANISHSFIADIESGRSNPSIDSLEALAQALDVSVTDLLDSEPDQNEEGTNKEQSLWERNNEPTPIELEQILKNSNVQFDGAHLDEDDKQEVIEFLRFAWHQLRKNK